MEYIKNLWKYKKLTKNRRLYQWKPPFSTNTKWSNAAIHVAMAFSTREESSYYHPRLCNLPDWLLQCTLCGAPQERHSAVSAEYSSLCPVKDEMAPAHKTCVEAIASGAYSLPGQFKLLALVPFVGHLELVNKVGYNILSIKEQKTPGHTDLKEHSSLDMPACLLRPHKSHFQYYPLAV